MITKKQFTTLNDLFDYYNESLFDGELHSCLVNMSRHKGVHGFFAPNRWKEKEDSKIHEISLNPDTMNRDDKEWHSTLVHEMVHLWQQLTGNTARRGYHCKKFASKMESIGLIPSSTGLPGGKKTGQNMTHYVEDGGKFEKAFENISDDQTKNLKLPYVPNLHKVPPRSLINVLTNGSVSNGVESDSDSVGNEKKEEKKSASGVKIKYQCSCENRVWGKSGLNIVCGDCNESFSAVE